MSLLMATEYKNNNPSLSNNLSESDDDFEEVDEPRDTGVIEIKRPKK